MSLMWMPPHTTRAARPHRAQRQRHQHADRREQDRGIERFGAAAVDGPAHAAPMLARERLASSSPSRVKA